MRVSCIFLLAQLILIQSPQRSAAFLAPRPLTTMSTSSYHQVPLVRIGSTRNFSKLHEETDDEVRLSEDAAALDAADCSDAGMEAVAEERAVMLANEIFHKKQEEKEKRGAAGDANTKDGWVEEHLVHGANQIHEETDDELRETEEMAAADAADCSDPGMEAAMEERAVMLAQEMAHKMKEKAAAAVAAKKKKKDDA